MDSTEHSPLLSSPPSVNDNRNESNIENGSAPASSDQFPGFHKFRGITVVFSIGALVFLQAANFSILTTIQSAVATDLDVYEKANWLTSSYLVAMSSVTPLMGRFNQSFTSRLCLVSATLIGSIGALVVFFSNSFPVFVIGRVIAGIGAGGIFGSTTIIIVQRTSHENRGLFLGLNNAAITAGVSLGAIIAGALEPKIGWNALFGMQTPVLLLAGFLLFLALEKEPIGESQHASDSSLEQKTANIDYLGVLTLTSAIVLFLVSLSGPKVLIVPLITSPLVLVLFLLIEKYLAKEPIIPIVVLQSRGTLFTCIATVGLLMARWAVLFYLPVYAIAVRGYPPAVAGTLLIPANAGFAIGSLLAGLLHIRRAGSFYSHSVLSTSIFPITMLLITRLSTPSSSITIYMFVAFANGLATGSTLNYALVHLLHLTYPNLHPIVISLLATFRGFASSFGSAIGGGIFTRLLISSLTKGFESAGLPGREDLIRKLVGSPSTVAQLSGTEKEVAILSYAEAIRGLFLAAVGLSTLVIFVQASTGKRAPT